MKLYSDVPDPQRAVAWLALQEQDLTDLFGNAPIAIHWLAADGSILNVNRAAVDLLGHTWQESLGRHLSAFYADENAVDEILGRLSAGEKLCGYEARLRCKNGAIKHVLIDSNVRKTDSGEVLHARCFIRDITDRKRAEEVLRESERRYRQLVHLLPAGIYTCEAPSGVITFYNDYAAKLWGRAPRIGPETDDRFCGSFRLWWPDERPLPHHETPMALALRDGRAVRNQAVIIERPDGSRVTVLVNIDPICDDNGHLVGAINTFLDTTASTKVEAK